MSTRFAASRIATTLGVMLFAACGPCGETPDPMGMDASDSDVESPDMSGDSTQVEIPLPEGAVSCEEPFKGVVALSAAGAETFGAPEISGALDDARANEKSAHATIGEGA